MPSHRTRTAFVGLLASSTLLVYAHESSRQLITVEGATAQDTSDIDPDDFLWEKLPGRCCFYGGPDPLDPSKWLGAHTCDQCAVWDLPNNYCHTSPAACLECGMQLYCDPTPPLIAGNKVCTGPSRVGHGCEDALGTGVCASHSLGECQTYCRNHPRCEMLVFYPQERQGTCILCADLAHYQEVTLESTRVYATTPAPPPPAYPRGEEHHYILLGGPSPPPPPHPPPSPPGHPPRPLSHLGRHHTRQHFECTYQPRTELSVDQSEGYTDRTAASKEECCNMCGIKAGCQDFVFEPGSGTCVLLPHVGNAEIVATPNEYTVSGSLQITVVKQALERHGECEFTPSSGFAGGNLGEGEPLPGGAPIDSKVDCCDACDRTPKCAKFTYETYSKQCIMYEAFAETYLTDGLLSGVVVTRSTPGSSGGAAASGASHSGVGGGSAESLPAWMLNPPPPVPPALNFFGANAPPPSPPPEMGDAASSVIAGMSMTIASLMGLGLCICAYCFFREDFLAVAEKASGTKRKKKNAYGTLGTVSPASADEDEEEGEPTRRKGGRKGKREKRGVRTAVDVLAEGYVRVRLETQALSQKKDVYVGEVDDIPQLREALWTEFRHALKGKRGDAMLLLCEGEESADGATTWLLITRDSEVQRVIGRGSIKIVDKPPTHSDGDFEVAFPKGGRDARGDRRKDRNKGGRDAKGEGRFADDDDNEGAPAGADGAAPARFADSDEEADEQEPPVAAKEPVAKSTPVKAKELDYTSDDERRSKRGKPKGGGGAMLE